MGDAARELADALHALGLGQALLELGAHLGVALAVGDVRGDGADRVDLAVGVAQRELDQEEVALLALAVGRRSSPWPRAARRSTDLGVHRLVPGDLVGRQDLVRRDARGLVGGHPEDLLPAPVDQQVAVVEVLDEHERRRVVDDRLQALLAARAGGLGAPALGDVDELAQEVQRPLAVAVHQRHCTSVDHVPVGVHVALDGVGAPAAVEQLLDERAVQPLVVRVAEVGQAHRPQVLLGAAEHLRDRAVHPQPAALEVDQGHADRGVVERARNSCSAARSASSTRRPR